jgi:CRISPR-associated protein Cas5h
MMKAVAFDVKGKVAHFRRPDTTATQLTYPFITPTAAKGLVGAILGIEEFVTSDLVGIQLLQPVRTVAQQMSMLGKDGGTVFSRPTTMELLVNPAYRIYYAGNEHVDRLIDFLQKGQEVYPTFLGSAFALTKPILVNVSDQVALIQSPDCVETKSIVPTRLIQELQFQENHHYSRAGGFMHLYKGERTFEKSIDFIYEREGKSISFIPETSHHSQEVQLAVIGEEAICLF